MFTIRGFALMLGLVVLTAAAASAQEDLSPEATETVRLWPGEAPGPVTAADPLQPDLYAFLPDPDDAVGTAVVVLPGGGYHALAMGHEGRDIAAWLNERGVAAFVVAYRRGAGYGYPIPMLDARRAVRYVRHNADRLGLDPDRVGNWGVSAGGHLASTLGTHIEHGDPQASDPVEHASARPDFMILCYPVISFSAPYTHQGSRRNLLGEDSDPELVALLSNENQVTPDTPPTFLFHTDADTGVPPENSVAFYLGLREAGVPAELHIYREGNHGVGLASADPVLRTWSDRLADWLRINGWIQ
jgi:acetyl esterase/lipase